MAAVEGDRLDPGCDRLFCEQLADRLGCRLVAAVLHIALHFFVFRSNGDERLAAGIVDDLAGQIAMAAENGEARPLCRATNALADAEAPPLALAAKVFVFVHRSLPCCSRSVRK